MRTSSHRPQAGTRTGASASKEPTGLSLNLSCHAGSSEGPNGDDGRRVRARDPPLRILARVHPSHRRRAADPRCRRRPHRPPPDLHRCCPRQDLQSLPIQGGKIAGGWIAQIYIFLKD